MAKGINYNTYTLSEYCEMHGLFTFVFKFEPFLINAPSVREQLDPNKGKQCKAATSFREILSDYPVAFKIAESSDGRVIEASTVDAEAAQAALVALKIRPRNARRMHLNFLRKLESKEASRKGPQNL